MNNSVLTLCFRSKPDDGDQSCPGTHVLNLNVYDAMEEVYRVNEFKFYHMPLRYVASGVKDGVGLSGRVI
jgi:hypothetical protein